MVVEWNRHHVCAVDVSWKQLEAMIVWINKTFKLLKMYLYCNSLKFRGLQDLLSITKLTAITANCPSWMPLVMTMQNADKITLKMHFLCVGPWNVDCVSCWERNGQEFPTRNLNYSYLFLMRGTKACNQLLLIELPFMWWGEGRILDGSVGL